MKKLILALMAAAIFAGTAIEAFAAPAAAHFGPAPNIQRESLAQPGDWRGERGPPPL